MIREVAIARNYCNCTTTFFLFCTRLRNDNFVIHLELEVVSRCSGLRIGNSRFGSSAFRRCNSVHICWLVAVWVFELASLYNAVRRKCSLTHSLTHSLTVTLSLHRSIAASDTCCSLSLIARLAWFHLLLLLLLLLFFLNAHRAAMAWTRGL